jgi:hypothetical protein
VPASSSAPGPDADAAFTLGLVAGTVLTLLVIALSFWSGAVSPLHAIVLAVLVLPAAFVLTACLLAVWLGYDRDAVDALELTDAVQEYTEE